MVRGKKLSTKEPAVSDEQDEKKELHPEYEAFLQWKRTRKTNESTLLTMKRRFLWFPDPDKLTVEHFERRLGEVRDKNQSNKTVRLELTYAKMFLKWAKRDFSHLQGFDLGKMEKSVTTEDLYTQDELIAIFAAAEPLRDRPMLEVLYESACRAGELLSMTCEAIRPGKGDTLIVNVKGKTGNRDIILEHSVPNLQRWRDYHPTKKGLLWVSQKRDENGDYKALSRTGLYLVAQKTIRRAGITGKKRKLHMFRHTRITELHKIGMQGLGLHGYVGWTEGSPMEKVYVHLDNSSILDEYYRLHGYSEQEQPREALQIVKCPKCGMDNGPAENWCKSCHEPLTEFARNLQEKGELEERLEALEEYIVVEQSRDPSFRLDKAKQMWEDGKDDSEKRARAIEIFTNTSEHLLVRALQVASEEEAQDMLRQLREKEHKEDWPLRDLKEEYRKENIEAPVRKSMKKSKKKQAKK